MLVAVLVCWLVLPAFLAHVLTGLAMVGVIALHLRTRRRKVRRLFRPRATTLRRGLTWVLLATTVAMVVSGALRWAGVAPEYAQHATSSYLMLTALVAHMVLVRRALWARLRIRAA